jgi:hypothetical protein
MTGSAYVYDALFTDAPEFLQQGLLSYVGAPSLTTAASPSFGLYGITISYTGFATGSGAIASQTAIASSTATAATTAATAATNAAATYDTLNAAAINAQAVANAAPTAANIAAAQNAATAASNAQAAATAAQTAATTAQAAATAAQVTLLGTQADAAMATANSLEAAATAPGASVATYQAYSDAVDNANTLTDAYNATITTTAADTAAASASTGIFSSISAAYATGNVTMSVGSVDLMFNYYLLAAELAIMVYEDLTSCNTNEQMLGLKRGQNLCTYIGTYCSNSINLLVGSLCVENTQSYCCYNSLLAQLINQQGRAQIGKGYGNVTSPDCSGFSTDQFAQIDFSKIDLSAFAAQIMSTIVPPQNAGITSNAAATVNQQIQSYYGTSTTTTP